jgi:enoyl-CoA hydratase/carnithine racemase
MSVAVDVLCLEPADLAAPLPAWEVGVAGGDVGIAVIDGSAAAWDEAHEHDTAIAELLAAPVITVGVVRNRAACALADRCDLVVWPGDGRVDERVEELVRLASRAPAPTLVAAQLLRTGDARIATESFAYSMLMAGEDFREWRRRERPKPKTDGGGQRVELARCGGVWKITLARPARHNAFDGQMREELCDALDAIASRPPAPVVIVGAGRSFCSGGDLQEFGSADSPLSAHLVRNGRSVARRLQRLRPRLVVGVHGHCIGAGIELAAFARHLVAATTTAFALPEIALGLNLGAGGAVSIPARVGRHRTLELLMRSRPIDAATARDWGLVDELMAPEDVESRCLEHAAELA